MMTTVRTLTVLAALGSGLVLRAGTVTSAADLYRVIYDKPTAGVTFELTGQERKRPHPERIRQRPLHHLQ